MYDQNMLMDAIEKFRKMKESEIWQDMVGIGQVEEAVLLCNPKHKEAMAEAMDKTGITFLIVWSDQVPEDKMYMVRDRDLIETVKRSIDFK